MSRPSDITTTSVFSGRRSNVESVLNDPDYVTSTNPYRGDEDDESYLEDVSTNANSLILRNVIKTVSPQGNSTFITTTFDVDVNDTYMNSSNVITSMILPSLTIADTELPESKTVKSTESLRHGPECTCDQHSPTSVTEMMPTVTESTTVSLITECTRHKLTPASTHKTISTHTATIEPAKTTDQIVNETTIEDSSPILSSTAAESTTISETIMTNANPIHETGGKCTCGMNTTPVMTTSSSTTEETNVINTTTPIIRITSPTPTTTVTNSKTTTISEEKTISSSAPVKESGEKCTCGMNITPVMTTSSSTTEETNIINTTTHIISTTSPTPITIATNSETTTISEETTKTFSAPVNEKDGKCTCGMNTTPVITTSIITTENTAASSAIVPTTSTMPTTPVTIIETTTISPDRKCTCNMQTNPMTTMPTTEVSTTTTLTTTTPLTTTTTTVSTTTSTINIRECTCGQTASETTTTSESTTTKTPEPTSTTELRTTKQITEPIRKCTCNVETISTVTSPSITTELPTTAELTTKETATEDITNNEIVSTTKKTTPSSSSSSSKAHVTCSAYPSECKRPSTWETTSKGETRDFFRILKERYGNRVKILRATTHWPLRIPKSKRYRDSFRHGRHNEG